MMKPRCPSCGHFIGHLQIKYDNGLKEINENKKLTESERSIKKNELINELVGKNFKLRYCCKKEIMSYVKQINIIL